jgi:anti-sigma regulatory factor (Ser/Thr protein kinase)
MIVRVTDPTHAGEARRYAAACAEESNLGETERGALAIVVTELATNLIKHAGTGAILLESVGQNGSAGVRVLGLDKGPGISNLTAALRDGYSTAGTPGNGLGAIKRLSHAFDICTAPGLGTAIIAEFWSRKSATPNKPLHVAAVSQPIKGEDVCGDGWAVRHSDESILVMVVDGLGHGILAAEAAREAERIFRESRTDSPAPILQDAHDALRKTRGAAMAIATLHRERKTITFAGIGNIGASIVGPAGSRGMASHNGTVGHHLHRIQEFTFPWSADSVLIMYSDGLKSGPDITRYPGVWDKHPGLVAGMLYRDFSRERDDATVLVAMNAVQGGLV